MKFLEDLYKKELNSPDSELTIINTEDIEGTQNYIINIDGNTFYPSEILASDSDLYNQAFEDWKLRKQDECLAKAEEILNLHDNRDRFNQLKQIYSRNSLIPFVGAGMSCESGYPSWSKFLFYLQENTDVPKEKIEEKISIGEFEEAAQLLFEDMGAPAFNELLSNTFGVERNIIGPINYLPYFFKTAVITTNYDPILKNIYDSASIPFEEITKGADAESFSASLGAGKRTLLKLHGDYAIEKDRVLTLIEYQRAYSSDSILNSLIETAFFSRTLLFLGCSLSQDRTIRKMEEYVAQKGHQRCVKHYCFLELHENCNRIAVRNRLSMSNIFPIWYPKGEHNESIEALLIALKGSL